jgi:hypothetical protein
MVERCAFVRGNSAKISKKVITLVPRDEKLFIFTQRKANTLMSFALTTQCVRILDINKITFSLHDATVWHFFKLKKAG